MRPPHLDRALAEFSAKLGELTVKTFDGRSQYVRVHALSQWMRQQVWLEDRPTKKRPRLHILVDAAHYGHVDFPPKIKDVGTECCVVVFSILLDLGLGHRIVDVRKSVADCLLPLELAALKDRLKGLSDGDDLAIKFNEGQWKFSPAQFTADMDKNFFESHIIPICRRAYLNSGGTATVWQISVQEEFVDDTLKSFLADDADAKYDDVKFGMCYTFALKTFESGNFQYFDDEKIAFDGLRHNAGVIRRLGCYSQTVKLFHNMDQGPDISQETDTWKDTKNILLEYGTLDLRLVFGHQSPPVLSAEIIRFWGSLFEVGNAVSGIHEFKQSGEKFNGWHADIKPENIILVRGKYKLADPGFARFKKASQHKDSPPPEILVHGGTDTYGAPEGRNGTKVHQTIDTWSLGCVFSVAATWVMIGWQGVIQYSKVREKALEKVLKESRTLSVVATPDKMDCFHDGCQVLPEVREWHNLLRAAARKTDPLTEQVLDLIDFKMLLKDPYKRIRSKDLCEELRSLVESAKSVALDQVASRDPESRQAMERLEATLSVIEKEAELTKLSAQVPTKASPDTESGTPIDRDREKLKSQLLNTAMKKTSHRFETIASSQHYDQNFGAPIPTIVMHEADSSEDVSQRLEYRPTYPPADMHLPRSTTLYRPPSRRPRRKTTGMKANVIQAREEMERDKGVKNPFAILTGKRRNKDEYLSKYFKNRDIRFLVDDSETMSNHWHEATYVLETLGMKAHGQDDDGMDLFFVNDRLEYLKIKDASLFRKAMQEVKLRPHVETNMKQALEKLLNAYIYELKSRAPNTKATNLTIIVLTDGLWRGMNDHNEVEMKIKEFDDKLQKVMEGMAEERQVSIQFIQFGDDPNAKERLRHLDDDMPNWGVKDMIDCESFSIKGNIYKMLLGSFVESIDAICESSDELSLAEDAQDSASMLSTSNVSEFSTQSVSDDISDVPQMEKVPSRKQSTRSARKRLSQNLSPSFSFLRRT